MVKKRRTCLNFTALLLDICHCHAILLHAVPNRELISAHYNFLSCLCKTFQNDIIVIENSNNLPLLGLKCFAFIDFSFLIASTNAGTEGA